MGCDVLPRMVEALHRLADNGVIDDLLGGPRAVFIVSDSSTGEAVSQVLCDSGIVGKVTGFDRTVFSLSTACGVK